MDSNYYYKEFFSVDKSSPKNDLEKYFFEGDSVSKKGIHKWFHYFEIYDRYFSKYRNKYKTADKKIRNVFFQTVNWINELMIHVLSPFYVFLYYYNFFYLHHPMPQNYYH